MVNTPRIGFAANLQPMSEEKSERLRNARKKAGFSSAQAAADNFGWKVAGYRHHENGTRNFGPDDAKRYGRAFKVKPGYLLCMEGIDAAPPTGYAASERLIVEGPVEAGVWREPSERLTRRVEIDLPPPIPEVKRFGVTVAGRSMDLHYEPGTVLDCISIFTNGVEPQSGDHVIVERIKPDGLREMTVKEFSERGGEYFLLPKSSDPMFDEMHIGKPDQDMIDGEEVRVIGFVVSAIPPRSLDLMRRMGKVREI